MVSGVDVRKYNLEALRDQVSMVLQKNVLFSGTIYDNIRWGNENATDEEVQNVCNWHRPTDSSANFRMVTIHRLSRVETTYPVDRNSVFVLPVPC